MPPPIKHDSVSGDEIYMARCLELAAEAAAAEEVPVGAVIVLDGAIVAEARNRTRERGDPLHHAEMLALHAAFAVVGAARLPRAEAYCSLEPCVMCTGALLHARVARVVFAAHDPKFGACGSLFDLPADPRLNHRCPVVSGVLAAASAELLQGFFRRLR